MCQGIPERETALVLVTKSFFCNIWAVTCKMGRACSVNIQAKTLWSIVSFVWSRERMKDVRKPQMTWIPDRNPVTWILVSQGEKFISYFSSQGPWNIVVCPYLGFSVITLFHIGRMGFRKCGSVSQLLRWIGSLKMVQYKRKVAVMIGRSSQVWYEWWK